MGVLCLVYFIFTFSNVSLLKIFSQILLKEHSPIKKKVTCYYYIERFILIYAKVPAE